MANKTRKKSFSSQVGDILNNRKILQVAVASSIVFNVVLLILLGAAFEDYSTLNRQVNGGVEEVELRTFRDEALGIELDYPAGWEIDTFINTDSKYEDPDVPVGKIPDLAQLDVVVNDGNTELRFVHFFGELPENVAQFPTVNKNYKVIDGRILRYQSADLEKWFYVDVADCEINNIVLDEALGARLCAADYFSGFVDGPSRVVLSGRLNSNILDLMDRVVLSALL